MQEMDFSVTLQKQRDDYFNTRLHLHTNVKSVNCAQVQGLVVKRFQSKTFEYTIIV